MCSVCHKFFLSGSDPCVCSEEEFGPKAGRMENPKSENNHPTLKPIQLNQYLSNLIKPPFQGEPLRLLNCFSGVCSEAIGAWFAGWQEIVCVEKEKEYVEIAQARVGYWTQFEYYIDGLQEGKRVATNKAKGKEENLPSLF